MKSCKRSSRARCSLADLTSLNPNVLFELGYAVAQHKRTWLLLDTSVTAAKADFNELRLLSTVGYKRYTNSEDVVRGVSRKSRKLTCDRRFSRVILSPA